LCIIFILQIVVLSAQPCDDLPELSESPAVRIIDQNSEDDAAGDNCSPFWLDGRYTQILKDGYPAYGGFSGTMSLLEIPPLDLKQVEIIKGPSATLFGAGAIAGVVNFISKTPEEEPVTSLVLNQTSALGTDFSIFNSRKFERFGYTLLGSANY